MTPPPGRQEPLCLRPPQAAARLGVSVKTLYRMLGAGEIRFVKARGATLIPTAELEAWVARKLAGEPHLLHRGRGYRSLTRPADRGATRGRPEKSP